MHIEPSVTIKQPENLVVQHYNSPSDDDDIESKKNDTMKIKIAIFHLFILQNF